MREKVVGGFTIIELLVVIVIIGILATFLLVNFNNARIRTRDTQRKSALRQIKTGLALYYSVWGEYPADREGQIVGCGEGSEPQPCSWGELWHRGETVYMKPLPAAPLSSKDPDYTYFYQKLGEGFILKALLENHSDGDITASQTKCLGEAAGEDYHYVVCQD